MEIHYYKEPSRFLRRDMEFKVFGHSGQPCLAFACEGGRFYDWEDHGLVAALAPLIESGKIQLFCADSIDGESWLGSGDERSRTELHERWFNYICGELVPRIHELCDREFDRILALGTSLGAGHAVSLYLRRPNLFCGAVGLSGSYLSTGWYQDYADDLLLRTCPVSIARLICSEDLVHYDSPLVICCGKGPYEERFWSETEKLAAALKKRGIPFRLECPGEDSGHDWNWWQQQLVQLVPFCLEQLH